MVYVASVTGLRIKIFLLITKARRIEIKAVFFKYCCRTVLKVTLKKLLIISRLLNMM